jgi:NADPH:quinone reductase-like Zn-dependent oxidoreductase
MRAIVQRQFGGPEVLTLAEVPDPVPVPTEVVVAVRAVGINPVEAYIRRGAFRLLGEPPFILGWDISGVVETVVPGTCRFDVGDEVYGMPWFPRAASAYAEKVTSPSRQLARKPRNLSHAEAAALPLVGLTAWQSLVDVAGLRENDRVLIHAGGGGVGHIAVQIAKARGAYVITTASAEKADFVRGLGADEVIDYRSTDFTQAVGDIDVVLETVGGDYGLRSLRTLKPGGQLVTIVGRNDVELARTTQAQGFRFAGVSVEPDYASLEKLTALVEEGRLKVHVARTFDLADAAAAHAFMETGPIGKVVMTV